MFGNGPNTAATSLSVTLGVTAPFRSWPAVKSRPSSATIQTLSIGIANYSVYRGFGTILPFENNDRFLRGVIAPDSNRTLPCARLVKLSAIVENRQDRSFRRDRSRS
jgi:hypothetical protein